MLVALTKPSNMSVMESTGYLCVVLDGEGGRSAPPRLRRIQLDKRFPVLERLRCPTAGECVRTNGVALFNSLLALFFSLIEVERRMLSAGRELRP